MTQIPGIYVEIKGDLAQLKKDMSQARQIVTDSATSISNSMNNALSGTQAKKGINSLIDNLGTLSRASKITGADLGKLGVDLGSLQKVTGTTGAQFAKLQSQLLQTQASKAQEKALRDIAKQAGLTQKEVSALGKQFGLSQTQIANVAGSTGKAGSAFSGLLGYITPAIAGMLAFQKITSAVSQEFVEGLKAVEDFGMSVAQSTALITTFSQRAKNGDVAGAYQEANNYAKELTLTLEMIDRQTIANSQDLRAMSETFIANGVLLDINNKKQVEGFTSVANALAIMTQGQNKDIQMRQEIRGLMDGEIRSQDKLGMLLKAQVPDIEKQLVKWREEGTTLEHLAELLKGFNAVTGQLENQWATVGSTMETIHNRILRGMFEPVFNDLIKLAKEFNKSMMDAEGQLTPLARGVIKLFTDGYEVAKSFFDANDKGWAKMIANATLYGQVASLGSKAFGLAKDFLSGYGNTAVEDAEKDITAVEQSINDFKQRLESGSDNWWEFQLFKDPAADRKYLQELTADFERLGTAISAAREADAGVELRRTGGAPKMYAPKLYNPPTSDSKSKASDLNAALNAEAELLKASEEKKLAIIKAGINQDQQANQNAYELGLSSYSAYLDKKSSLTQKALKADLDAKEKELAAARDAADKLSPITDKDGKSRPDKDAKVHADALKKVEDAEKAVIEARNKLTEAEVDGAHLSAMANKEMSDSYKQIEIQLLDMQGKSVEAAQLQAKFDEESIERKRLIAEADAGSAEAATALAAAREMSAQKIRDAELETLTRSREAILGIAEIDGEYQKSIDLQTELLDIEIKRAQQAGKLPEEIALIQRQRQELEKMKTPMTAFVKGWQDVVKHQKTASEQMYDLAKKLAEDMQQTFSNVFFDVMKGDFKSIGDEFEDMAKRMLDDFLRMLADMAAAWAANKIFTWIFGSGTGISFSASGSGGSGGIGSSVASTAVSAATSYAAEQYLGTSVTDYIMSDVVYPAIAEASAAITGTTAASAAAASSTSIAAGTATPAMIDAYAATQSGVAASTAAGSTAAGAEAAGTSTAGMGASMAAYAGPAAIAAMAAAVMIGINTSTTMTRDRLNSARITPTGLGQLGGIDTDGQLTRVSGEASKALGMLYGQLGSLNAISIDAANGIAVFAQNVTNPETGLITAVDYSIQTFDNASGAWVKSQVNFQELLNTMQDMNPVSEDAIATTADYVATMAGVPSVADELATAFVEMQSGIYGLAGSATSASGTIAGAIAMMNSNSGIWFQGGNRDGGDSNGYATENYTNPDITGASSNSSPYFEGHADGGIHYGGWRIVGERGPELEYTPPSRIFSNTDTNSILSGLKGQDKNETQQPAVIHNHFYVDGKEIASTIMPAIDKHVASKAARGQLGQRTAF